MRMKNPETYSVEEFYFYTEIPAPRGKIKLYLYSSLLVSTIKLYRSRQGRIRIRTATTSKEKKF